MKDNPFIWIVIALAACSILSLVMTSLVDIEKEKTKQLEIRAGMVTNIVQKTP